MIKEADTEDERNENNVEETQSLLKKVYKFLGEEWSLMLYQFPNMRNQFHYGTGCVLNLGMLLWRYPVIGLYQVGVEHNDNIEDSR